MKGGLTPRVDFGVEGDVFEQADDAERDWLGGRGSSWLGWPRVRKRFVNEMAFKEEMSQVLESTMSVSDSTGGSKSLANRLADIFRTAEPEDDAVRSVLEHQRQVRQRIETVRKEASRSVRPKENRFHL